MPKNGWLRNHQQQVVKQTRIRWEARRTCLYGRISRGTLNKKRGGSCAHKNHIGMYGMQEP